MNYKINHSIKDISISSIKDTKVNNDTIESESSIINLVASALRNLENSNNPDHDLETIFINAPMCQGKIDHILKQCNAIGAIYNFLQTNNTELIIHSLCTLYQLTLISPYTVYLLSDQYSPLFVNLIENSNITIQLSILFSSVLSRSQSSNNLAYFLCFQQNFVKKILEFIEHVSDGLQFSQLLQMVTKIFENLTIEQANQKCFGIKLIKLPISMLQNSILSRDVNVLIPVLQCFRVIILKWEESLQFCITHDVLIQMYNLLNNAHMFGDDGQVFEELINFINVFIFGVIGKDEIGITECLISGMYKQIEFLPKKTPIILSTFAKIAYYQKTAAAFVRSEYFPKIFEKYNFLSFSSKIDYLIIFLNASYRCPQNVIDICEDTKSFLADAFEILSETPDINRQKEICIFLKAVFSLFSADGTLMEAFDCEEFTDVLNKWIVYFNDLEIVRVAQQILQAFYSEEEESDVPGPFL